MLPGCTWLWRDTTARTPDRFAPARQGRSPAGKSDTFTDLRGLPMKAAFEGVPYMNLDNLLRDYARQDLCRFCPKPEHYLTDKELAWPLLTAPGLAPRERVAATALDALASFEALVKRTVEETTSPALDMNEQAPEWGMTFDQVRQIWARREVFRRAALVYARMLGDEQLIEHYQTPEPGPERESADSTVPVPVVAENASDAPVVKPKARRCTWWDVSSAYIVEVMQAGQYATCKELYRTLEAKAGPDSPFDKGTGTNRGSLFVREIEQSLSLKTVQNEWRKLGELAKK